MRVDEMVVAPQFAYKRYHKIGFIGQEPRWELTFPVIITRKGSRRKKINIAHGSHANGPGKPPPVADTIDARLASR